MAELSLEDLPAQKAASSHTRDFRKLAEGFSYIGKCADEGCLGNSCSDLKLLELVANLGGGAPSDGGRGSAGKASEWLLFWILVTVTVDLQFPVGGQPPWGPSGSPDMADLRAWSPLPGDLGV